MVRLGPAEEVVPQADSDVVWMMDAWCSGPRWKDSRLLFIYGAITSRAKAESAGAYFKARVGSVRFGSGKRMGWEGTRTRCTGNSRCQVGRLWAGESDGVRTLKEQSAKSGVRGMGDGWVGWTGCG